MYYIFYYILRWNQIKLDLNLNLNFLYYFIKKGWDNANTFLSYTKPVQLNYSCVLALSKQFDAIQSGVPLHKMIKDKLTLMQLW